MYDANLPGPEDGAVISGALAAAVTPLRSGGTAVDDEAVGPLVDFLVAGGLDGLLAMGSTGESIFLTVSGRKRLTDLFVAPGAHGPAVLSARRGVARLAFRRCGAGMCTDAVLRVRVRRRQRVRNSGRSGRAAARRGAEPGRAEGFGRSVRTGCALSAGRTRRLHRRREPDRRRDAPRCGGGRVGPGAGGFPGGGGR